MGRFNQVRANLRKAYETSRERVSAARVERGDDDPASARRAYSQGTPAPQAENEASAEPPGDDAVPRSLRIAAAWSWRIIVIALVVYGLLQLVGMVMLLVAPLLIALLLTGLLMPLQRLLLRLRVHRSLAALLVLVTGIAVVGGTLTLVINQFVQGVDDMVDRVEQGVEQIQEWTQTGPLNMSERDLDNLAGQLQEWFADNQQQLTQGALTAVTGAAQFLTGMILAIVVTFFFLRDGSRIFQFLVSLLPAPARGPMTYAGAGAWRSLSGYVRATVLVALVDAVGIGVGLQILHWTMEFPSGLVLPIAALVFLGGFVPIVGAFVSGTVAVLVGLVSGEDPARGLVQALIVLGIVLVVQQLESNVLQPFIVSRMVRIHPLAVVLAVLAGILLAGILGALVAVPLVAVINTVVRRLHAYHHRPPPEAQEPERPSPPSSSPESGAIELGTA